MIYTFDQEITKAQLIIGDYELSKKFSKAKKLTHFTFIRSQHSEVNLKVDNTPLKIGPQEIASLTPNQNLEFIDGNAVIIYQFNKEFYCIKDHDKEVNCLGVLFLAAEKVPIFQLGNEDIIKYNFLHEEIVQEFLNKDSIQAEMLQLLIKNFVIKSTRLIKKQHLNTCVPKQDLLNKFNILVEQHFMNERQVAFYAEKLFKSPKTLSNQFHKLDTNPLQIIHDRIILETKRLLQYSELSFKEISHKLGYKDPSGLSRLFKKQTNTSPSDFRIDYHNLQEDDHSKKYTK